MEINNVGNEGVWLLTNDKSCMMEVNEIMRRGRT